MSLNPFRNPALAPRTPDDTVYFWASRPYRWSGWLGAQLESYERRRPPAGAERRMFGRDFRIFSTKREGAWYRCAWTLTRIPEDIDKANHVIREFQSKIREGGIIG